LVDARPAARSRGPGAEMLPHRAPSLWVQGGAGMGWVWCGPGCPTWPLGRWVRWPVTPTGTGAGPSAPPPYRRLRVFSAHRPAVPQLQVHTCPGIGCNSPSFGKASSDRNKLPSYAHFHSLTRSCADSDWRSGAHQGHGPFFRHTGCATQPVDMLPRSTTRGRCFCGDLRGAP
jgi:hypothetical protein